MVMTMRTHMKLTAGPTNNNSKWWEVPT